MGDATFDHSRIALQRLATLGLAAGVLVADRVDQLFLDVVAQGQRFC